jgi:hypothetical protein
LLFEGYNCVYKLSSEKMATGPVFTFPLFWWYAMEFWIYTCKFLCGVSYWNEPYCHLFTSSWRYRKLHIRPLPDSCDITFDNFRILGCYTARSLTVWRSTSKSAACLYARKYWKRGTSCIFL